MSDNAVSQQANISVQVLVRTRAAQIAQIIRIIRLLWNIFRIEASFTSYNSR